MKAELLSCSAEECHVFYIELCLTLFLAVGVCVLAGIELIYFTEVLMML